MKIALTGASSTGKTTLMEDLLETASFKDAGISSIKLDIRKIIDSMHLNVDGQRSSRSRLRAFQWSVLREKIKNEAHLKCFITDRSSVDMAAYWIARDSDGRLDKESELYLSACKEVASKYDIHIHLPFGSIPFIDDGKRPTSESFNQKTCEMIESLLEKWKLPYLSLTPSNRNQRVDAVLNHLSL